MDFSTIVRFNLPVTVVIFNNGGIYNHIGVNPSTNPEVEKDPAPTTLDFDRYDMMGEVFKCDHAYVSTPAELQTALEAAIASGKPNIINVDLGADAGKESGHIGYLNPTPLIDYTV